MNLEAAIELPAKYAKHAKTEREVKVHEERWLHPAGERWSQRRQGLDGAVFRMFSVFGGPVLTKANNSTAAFRINKPNQAMVHRKRMTT